VPGHGPDGHTHPGQVRSEGIADLAGPEHDVQPVLAYARFLAGFLTHDIPFSRLQQYASESQSH
jgi:hypothetical protein